QGSPDSSQSGSAPDQKEIEKIVNDLLKKKEEEKKQKDDEKKAQDEAKKQFEEEAKQQEGAVVGSDLKMSGRWTPGGLIFETANRDFQFHVGGRIEFDQVWWNQPAQLQGAGPGGNLGALQN